MPTEFGKLLESLARKHFKSMRGLARHLAPADEETNASYWSKVVRGKHPPPPEWWERWADALALEGAPRQQFMDLAAIAHIPDESQLRFLRMLDGFEKADAREQALQSQLDEVQARVTALESQLKRTGKR